MMAAGTKAGVSGDGKKRSVWGYVLEVAVKKWIGFRV